MGLNLDDFRRIVNPALMALTPELPYSYEAFRLTLETIWHESGGLTYLFQRGNGPARGLGQCEKPTFDWLTRDYLPNQKPAIWRRFEDISPTWPYIVFEELTWNLRLSVALCRVRYLPDPDPIPSTIEGRGAYWGRVYQTTNDPEKIRQYIESARGIK